ncbi:MAG: autotransporter outer membrane beta-barrel domain-containing protein [Alphaproteobacteria bacterium]|nr:autotransporter outer membrane beta-barrel domain-containing protein [Alphaproteobacteria bacterium]
MYGKRLARFGTEFNTSVTYDLSENTSLNVGYEGKFRKHYQDHTGYLNFRYEF